ncbi:MAG: molybdenum cofactor guanylyltransferase MobA [Pseudomonadota bacterium]
MPIDATVTGLILAGGRGSRMGHVDKGLQPFRGATMVQHVMQRLAPQVAAMAVNANQNLERYAEFGMPVWPDDLAGFEGPLAGLETGLRRCATPCLVTAPCDSPFVPANLVARLSEALQADGADLALAETVEAGNDGVMRVQPQPVFALVRSSALPHLTAYLAGGGRRMDGWYGAIKVVRVRFDDASAFRNINTLLELQQYEADQ